jgi:hypothetical protein
LNHKDIPEPQWVQGAKVVVGCAGESKIAPELIPKYAKELEQLGVPLVQRPEEMIGRVDGVLIESLEGGAHLARAKPFLEAGVPCFVDKPFACRLAEAREMAALAAVKKVPLFSSSSLRFAPEVVKFCADSSHGRLHGVSVLGPSPLHPRNPGFFHYGIHAVETLFTLMGPGCDLVTCTHERDVDVATGRWKDGRVATVRGIRAGSSPYGFTAFADKGVSHYSISTEFIYRELLRHIVRMFETRKPPVDIGVTLEIVAFIEAALMSADNHGNAQRLGT